MFLRSMGAGTAALVALVMAGCGGGSDSGGGGDTVTRELLTGGGTKTWRLVAISGNQNYNGTGSDQACPVTLDSKIDDTQVLTCGSSDTTTISADGTFKFKGFGKTWTLDGTRVTLDFGTAIGTQVSEVVPVVVDGKQRLRLLQISFTRGGVAQTHDDGSVLVLEEAGI